MYDVCFIIEIVFQSRKESSAGLNLYAIPDKMKDIPV